MADNEIEKGLEGVAEAAGEEALVGAEKQAAVDGLAEAGVKCEV